MATRTVFACDWCAAETEEQGYADRYGLGWRASLNAAEYLCPACSSEERRVNDDLRARLRGRPDTAP